MSEYYGVTTPANDFLAHYGVKGMKWGVRRALASKKHKDIKLARQYKKANKKLQSLKRKADVIENLDKRKMAPALTAAGLIPLAAGTALPIVAKAANHKLGVSDKLLSGFNALAGAGMVGLGVHDMYSGGKHSKAKGHERAVKKVNNWQKEMKNTFKGTKYSKKEDLRPEYKDTYSLYEHGTLGKDNKGRVIPYRVPTVSINGSSLVRDKNEKAKQIFKKRLSDPPVTQRMSDSKVLLAVHTPSGKVHAASYVDDLIKIKKKKRK